MKENSTVTVSEDNHFIMNVRILLTIFGNFENMPS